jgi:hypothetical protein
MHNRAHHAGRPVPECEPQDVIGAYPRAVLVQMDAQFTQALRLGRENPASASAVWQPEPERR